MKEQLEQRLNELKREFESGQKALAELEAKQSNIRDTLLRISGAIQVLQEELAKADQLRENSTELHNGGLYNTSESGQKTASTYEFSPPAPPTLEGENFNAPPGLGS